MNQLTPKQAEVIRLLEEGWLALRPVNTAAPEYRLVSPDGETKKISGSTIASLCNQGRLQYKYNHPTAQYVLIPRKKIRTWV